MTDDKEKITSAAKLRKKAESLLASEHYLPEVQSEELDAKRLLHELQIHVIEMQNEELNRIIEEVQSFLLEINALHPGEVFLHHWPAIWPVPWIRTLTNVPAEGSIESIRQHKADLFGISSTMFFNIPKVIQLVEATRKEFGDSVRIMLGGGAFRTVQELPPELEGCQVALNLRETLERTHKSCKGDLLLICKKLENESISANPTYGDPEKSRS